MGIRALWTVSVMNDRAFRSTGRSQTVNEYHKCAGCQPVSSQAAKTKLRLAPFPFRVEYVSGKAIPVADALSRAPIGIGNNDLVDDIEAYINIVAIAGLPVSDILFGEFCAATPEDQQLSVVLSYLQSSWPKERHYVGQKARPFWDIRHTPSCVDGIILRGKQNCGS